MSQRRCMVCGRPAEHNKYVYQTMERVKLHHCSPKCLYITIEKFDKLLAPNTLNENLQKEGF